MSGLQDRLKGKAGAADKPGAPVDAGPVRHHWREIFDDGVHNLGRLVTLFVLGVVLTAGGAGVGIAVQHYDAEERRAAAGEVVRNLGLLDPETASEEAARDAILAKLGPPTAPVNILWRPFAATALFMYLATLIATRPWRRK